MIIPIRLRGRRKCYHHPSPRILGITAMNRSDMAFKLPVPSDDNEGQPDYYCIGGDPPAVGRAERYSLPTEILLEDQHNFPLTRTAYERQKVDFLFVVVPPTQLSASITTFCRLTIC
uniref:Uncharacterized protein n=1 Tax=Anopheles minimus TaxID=112268 RepID=A0A182W9A8_9DIPT